MSHYIIAHIGHSTKWSEHIHWWKPESKGYTFDIDRAGLYDLREAEAICDSGVCIAVSKHDAGLIAKGNPFFRRSDGELRRLYDVHCFAVVPNSAEAWQHLFKCCIYPNRKKDKPTPIGKKARAIYLPGVMATV